MKIKEPLTPGEKKTKNKLNLKENGLQFCIQLKKLLQLEKLLNYFKIKTKKFCKITKSQNFGIPRT